MEMKDKYMALMAELETPAVSAQVHPQQMHA
jgi:hypothetical protein